ncbi:MAG: hypothetical protein AABZ45_02650 [Pseudomonadota bacterium]
MRKALLIMGSVGTAALLSGCVAAVLPVLAAGTMLRGEAGKNAAEAAAPTPPVPTPPQMTPMPAAPRADYASPIAATTPTLTALPANYQGLVDHVRTRTALAAQGAPVTSLVLENALTLREPAYVDCGNRTPAVLVDLDDATSGPVTAMTAQPGESAAAAPAANADIVAALRQLRAAGTRIVWITELPDSAATTIGGWLHRTGLDPESNDTLYAAAPGLERKQLLRRRAAEQFCIIAVVGDRKSDAEEAYDYLRNPDAPLVIDANWGSGWFLLPAPLTPHE